MKDIVTPEEALILKDLGFDLRCTFYYENGKPKMYTKSLDGWNMNNSFLTCCSAPTYSKVFKWFRDKFRVYPTNHLDQTMEPKFAFTFIHYIKDFEWSEEIRSEYLYRTHELSEQECLLQIIKYIKNKEL